MRAYLFLFAGVLPLAAANAHIDYVTYLGGSATDRAVAVAVDGAGDPIIAGTTSSPDFPLTSGALGSPVKGPCAFLTKLNANGTAIQWSVCLQNLGSTAMTLDASGNIYLLALNGTASQVVKITPDASAVVWTTTVPLLSTAIAVDSDGNVYVAGAATNDLAATSGAFQRQLVPGTCPGAHPTATTPCADGFVIKLSPLGQTLFATYLGGKGSDTPHAVAVDTFGNVWVAGETVSPDFPVTADALQRTFHGEIDFGPLQFGDGFIAKLDPTGSKLLYSSYLGGSGPDAVKAMAIDESNSVYVTGGTQSGDFPTTPGALHTADCVQLLGAVAIAFVSKFAPGGTLTYSATVPGGAAASIAINKDYEAVLAAYSGPGNVIPVQRVPPAACAGAASPGLIKLSADGSAITGSALVSGGSVALDAAGRAGVHGGPDVLARILCDTGHF